VSLVLEEVVGSSNRAKKVVECIREGMVPWALCTSAGVIRYALDALLHVPWVNDRERPLDTLSICGLGPLDVCSQLPAVSRLLAALKAGASPDLNAASLAFSRQI